MKLVIDRKQWRRGPQTNEALISSPTALLCNDGTKCCLGFYALQCGLTEEKIQSVGEPSEINFVGKDLPKGMEKLVRITEEEGDEWGPVFYTKDTYLTRDAIKINDGSYGTEAEREQYLTELFAQEGIEVEFHG